MPLQLALLFRTDLKKKRTLPVAGNVALCVQVNYMKSDLASMTKHNVQLPNYSFTIDLFLLLTLGHMLRNKGSQRVIFSQQESQD